MRGPEFDGGWHEGEWGTRPAQHRADERFAQRDKTDDRRVRIAGQPDQGRAANACCDVGKKHGVTGSYGDAVDMKGASIALDGGTQMVTRTSGGATGRDNEVGSLGRPREGRGYVIEIIDYVIACDDLGTKPGKPAWQLRPERVAHASVGGDSGVLELITEKDNVHARPAHHGHVIMSGGGEESGQGWRDDGADPGDEIAGPALLAGLTDIGPSCSLGVDVAAVDAGILPADDGACASRHDGARGDARGGARGEGGGQRCAGVCLADDGPRAVTRNGPAVHRRAIEGRQVAEGDAVRCEHSARRIGNRDLLRGEHAGEKGRGLARVMPTGLRQMSHSGEAHPVASRESRAAASVMSAPCPTA